MKILLIYSLSWLLTDPIHIQITKALKPIVFKITMMKNNLKQVDTEAFLLLEDDILCSLSKVCILC